VNKVDSVLYRYDFFNDNRLTMPETPLIYRKHWIAYISPIIIILFALYLCSRHNAFLSIVGIFCSFSAILRSIRIASITWTLTSSYLIIERGLLPWKKYYAAIPIFQIYDSSYRAGMFGYFLNYGSVWARRNDGNNSTFYDKSMANAKELSVQINTLVHNYETRRKECHS